MAAGMGGMRASGTAIGSHASGVTVETDVAVIGAGPVGLFAVFQCGMLRMRCVVVDALDAIGGQCAALYPEKPIFDIPAHPEIEGGALIHKLEAQAAPFTPLYLLGRRVETLRELDGEWQLGTSAGDTIKAKAVILAAGAGAFGPNRPPLEGLPGYEASGAVRYLVARREDFRGKRVVIAGGGDSAVDWALSLKEVAAHVTVVHRRPKFRAAPESSARLDAAAARGEVEMAIPYQLHGLEGDGSRLTGVVLSTLKGEVKTVPADHLLAFYGLSMELGPIAHWGLGLHHSHVTVAPATCETSLPGIHAIGDIATYPGKLKLILQGFSEAAMAAHAIHPRVFPGEALHFEYSTSKGVPAA
jgi:thioredoxin reductase (NADPH)